MLNLCISAASFTRPWTMTWILSISVLLSPYLLQNDCQTVGMIVMKCKASFDCNGSLQKMTCSLLFDWFRGQINPSLQSFRYLSKAWQPLNGCIRSPLRDEIGNKLLYCFLLRSMLRKVPTSCRDGYWITHQKVAYRWYCWLWWRSHEVITISFTDGLWVN